MRILASLITLASGSGPCDGNPNPGELLKGVDYTGVPITSGCRLHGGADYIGVPRVFFQFGTPM